MFSEWYFLSFRFSDQSCVRISHLSHSRMLATWPVHLIILDLITLIFGEAYNLWSSSFYSFLQSSATSSPLEPNILNSVFWDTLNPCSFPSVRDHVSHPYKTTG
jgi:hypothetical protein